MRKLIEVKQNSLITCDRHGCGFEIPFNKAEDNKYLVMYVNTACPKCEENLLTAADYLQSRKIEKMINWINKWFSWLTLFQGKVNPEDEQSVLVYVNDGVKIKCEKLEKMNSDTENLKTYTWKDLKEYKQK